MRGEGLPLAAASGGTVSSPIVAFSGPTRVGFVIAAHGDSDTLLAAIRLVKENGTWRVDSERRLRAR